MDTTQSLSARIQARVGSAVDRLYDALSANPVTRYPWAVVQTFSKAQGALLAGSMAYYTFLSLLPLLMISSFVLGSLSLGNDDLRDAIIQGVEQLFPGIGGRQILNQLVETRVVFGVLGLITVSYAGSGFVGALTASMNQMWEIRIGRNPVGQKLVNFFVILLLGAVLLGSTALTIWTAYVTTRLGLAASAADVASWAERIASPLSLFLVLLLLYKILPACRLSWRSQVPGALAGALAIELLKRGFTFWAQNSAGVAVLPRTLLSVVLLLVWLGFFGQAILYGAAVNVVRERRQRGAPLMPPEDSVPEGMPAPPIGPSENGRSSERSPTPEPRT